jgi:hypothetical protein
MIMVRLSRHDEITAHTAGLERESRYGSNPKFNGNKGNFHNAVVIHSEAVGAEIAVARYFDIKDFVPTVNTFKNEPDINLGGLGLEVKQTAHKNGHLIITDDDRDSDIAVLVVGESPSYYLVGWIPVGVAKRPRFLSAQGGYWISQINLQPIESLKRSKYVTDIHSGI